MTSPRPPFDPVQCETEWQDKLATDTQHLIPVVQCSAHFPQSVVGHLLTDGNSIDEILVNLLASSPRL